MVIQKNLKVFRDTCCGMCKDLIGGRLPATPITPIWEGASLPYKYKWHACLNSCTRYVFNLGVKPIQTINVFQYARLGQESPTEHNDKASSAYDFLHGKSKSSVEAVEQEHTLL